MVRTIGTLVLRAQSGFNGGARFGVCGLHVKSDGAEGFPTQVLLDIRHVNLSLEQFVGQRMLDAMEMPLVQRQSGFRSSGSKDAKYLAAVKTTTLAGFKDIFGIIAKFLQQ